MERMTFRRSNIFLGERHTSIFQRLTARGIDLLIGLVVYFLGSALWVPLGVLFSVTYYALQDGWGLGQSIGKRIIGLRVIEDQTGLPCSFRSSIIRNLPFVMALMFASITVFWVFFILLALPLLVIELYLVVSLESGVRVGDVLGNTLVIEYIEGYDATSVQEV